MGIADTSGFETKASSQGYAIVKRSVGPSEGLDDHDHDYDVWGLVTEGEFQITVDGETRRYPTGSEFRLEAGCPHSERAGPDGASLVVGRLHR